MKQQIIPFFSLPFVKIILARPVTSDGPQKCILRPILLKGQTAYQSEIFQNNQAFHKNMPADEAILYVENLLTTHFKEIYILLKQENWQGTVKNNRLILKKRPFTGERHQNMNHNRSKKYLIEEGTPVPALIELGIMDKNGRIYPTQRDKFIQINQFLNVFDQALNTCNPHKELIIWDLCCGKSYLTFILDYFLSVLRHRTARFIGVDLKPAVIQTCTQIRQKLKRDNLTFICGNVQTVSLPQKADIVVSLHACDTATDAVIKRGIQSGASAILAEPCCHKEVSKNIASSELDFMLGYGLLKERFAALVTDALRARFLENNGYKTDVLEFVNFENSPKNIMIRAFKTNQTIAHDLTKIAARFHIHPTILKND